MKKLFAVLLALTLVLSMGTIALAADGDTTATGTITISNALADAEYNIYKMFDFTPVEGSTTQGRYTYASDDWKAFVETGAGKDYLEFNADTGTIEWNGAKDADGTTPEATAVAALAKAAVAYAKDNKIAATATKKATADGAVTFDGVALGYYAIDTSLGTICALTNVDNTFETHEKNAKPEIEKEVKEDSTGDWGEVNDAEIGQKVEYKATIKVAEGAVNYVMHDTMDAGLTFNKDVVVTASNGSTPVYEVKTTDLTDGCTFEVAFDNDYIATLPAGTTLEVTYSATVNENAVIAEDGNDNKVVLKYGDKNDITTKEDFTETYVWKMDVLKWTKGDGEAKLPLAGAHFMLLRTKGDETSAIKFTKVADAAIPTYKVDPAGTVTTIETDAEGKFEIIGLDEGTYYLHETVAPKGYNKLADDITVTITSTVTTTTNTYDKTSTATVAPAEDGLTVEVENKTGSLLPETGGIGTTIFYVVGGILMLAALVLLVSKKRMANFA